MRDLDSDTIADARNALGCRVPIERVAGHFSVTVTELRQALGMPLQLKGRYRLADLCEWLEVSEVDRQKLAFWLLTNPGGRNASYPAGTRRAWAKRS